MMNSVLSIENLTITIGTTLVIENLSLTVHSGEFLAIIGPNGAGKSTLLRALLGLIPYDGSITWNEQNIGYLPGQDRINRAVRPCTVADFFSLKKMGRERAIQALKTFGLSPLLLDFGLASLSTGQFQRMLLGFILLQNYSVLVLDEPIAGLDFEAEKLVYDVLSAFPALTIIMVTHHLHFILQHASRIMYINRRKIFDGTPSEISLERITELYEESEMYGH